jgi:tetratricopeptide (TPR) repeat protein
MVAASVTHWLRGERMLALERVNAALASGRYEEVLARADEVERWPGVGKRGRADYMRGEAYLGLGDRSAAEAYLVKAVAGDPDYFWPLADLAALRAGGAGTVAERRAVVAPLVTSLRGRFGSHPDLGRVLAKIDRLVGAER